MCKLQKPVGLVFFPLDKIHEAQDHADAGGRALIIHGGGYNGPACFQNAKEIGKILDMNIDRLFQTARMLGVKKIKVDLKGKRGQHVDLCGKPLVKAKDLAASYSGKLKTR